MEQVQAAGHTTAEVDCTTAQPELSSEENVPQDRGKTKTSGTFKESAEIDCLQKSG